MQTILPCPICQHALTFVGTPPTLSCPFCSAGIRFPRDKIPMGEKVHCPSCQGVFTAESPPPMFRVFAAAPEPCPYCQVLLAIRSEIPPGSVVRCPNCRKKFHTRGSAPSHAHHPSPECREPTAAPAPQAEAPPAAPALQAEVPASRDRHRRGRGQGRFVQRQPGPRFRPGPEGTLLTTRTPGAAGSGTYCSGRYPSDAASASPGCSPGKPSPHTRPGGTKITTAATDQSEQGVAAQGSRAATTGQTQCQRRVAVEKGCAETRARSVPPGENRHCTFGCPRPTRQTGSPGTSPETATGATTHSPVDAAQPGRATLPQASGE